MREREWELFWNLEIWGIWESWNPQTAPRSSFPRSVSNSSSSSLLPPASPLLTSSSPPATPRPSVPHNCPFRSFILPHFVLIFNMHRRDKLPLPVTVTRCCCIKLNMHICSTPHPLPSVLIRTCGAALLFSKGHAN